MNSKLQHTSKSVLFASLFAFLAVAVSCKKDDDNNPQPTETGKVAFLNGAFGGDSLNFFVDTKKANSKLLGFGDHLAYVNVTVGDRAFELKGKDDKSIVKKSFKTEKDKSYSIFASNSADGKTFELIQVTDDLTAPTGEKAKVRFIHLSPDAGKLNLESGESVLAQNISYKGASAYKEVDAKKTSFEIVDVDAEQTILTVEDLTLAKGKIYTIWVSGLQDSEDEAEALNARVFTNK